MSARAISPLLAAGAFALAAALSSCASQHVNACRAAFTKDLAQNWGIEQKLWNEDCDAGRPAAGIRKAAELAFWRRCQARFGPAVSAKLVTSDELKQYCLTPDGARWLEARWSAGDKPVPAPPAPASAVVAVATAAFSQETATTTVASVALSTPPAAEMAVSSPAAPAPPKIEPWVQPHPGAPLASDLPPLRPPFDGLARLIIKTADPEDAWKAVSALKRGKPYLISDGSRGEPYGLVIPVPPEAWIVTLTPGYIESPLTQGKLATNAQAVMKYYERHGLTGRPAPLAAVNPLDAQRKLLVSKPGEPRRYGYPDGSVRVEYTSGQLASTFLQELVHVDRRLDGGGADRLADERDAQQAECRLLFRFRQGDSGLILDAATHAFLNRCQRRKGLTFADLLSPYTDIPELGAKAGERRATPEDQRLSRQAEAFQQVWRKRIAAEFVGRFRKWIVDSQQDMAMMAPTEAQRARAQMEVYTEEVREDPWALIPGFDWTKPFSPPQQEAGN